jgi:tetratricopeptide (TPR) repeat protein
MLFGLMLLPLSCAIAIPTAAQTAKHAAGSRQVADEASRRQLAAYLADFQKTPDDATLRNEIVELAKTINPAPAIPDLARANFTQATAQVNGAVAPEEYKAAAKLFEQAAVQAPWYADADFSAASAYSKAEDYDDAKRNLDFYLAAVRPGGDIQKAENLRRDLDAQQATQQFQQTLQQFVSNPSDTVRMGIIRQAQTMKPAPEIPEEARGHYVMAVVLATSSEGSPEDEQHAIEEFKAALLAAPWWGDAYKKLATAQTAAGKYDDAIATLNFYLLAQPTEARNTQDEIYRLKALERKAADEQAKQQTEEQQRLSLEDKKRAERAAIDGMNVSVEGKWYQASTPNVYFAGGQSNPECDYVVKQSGGRWSITNGCSKSSRAIDNIEVQPRQLSFRLSGRDSGFPYSEVDITLTLSNDGQTLEGRGNAYDKNFFPLGDHPVRWLRRD